MGTPNPELLRDVVLRELERIYCECVEQEPPINPARTCSQCGMFIDFDNIPDWNDWVASRGTPGTEPCRRCLKCWKGATCACADPEYLEERRT